MRPRLAWPTLALLVACSADRGPAQDRTDEPEQTDAAAPVSDARRSAAPDAAGSGGTPSPAPDAARDGGASPDGAGQGDTAPAGGDARLDTAVNGAADASAADPTEAVFDRNRLHEIVITTDPANLAKLGCPPKEERVSATIVFDGVTLQNVGIRYKGQTSCRGPNDKMGFSIKFNEFVPGQKLFGLKKLALNNTVQDPTWLTEILTYDTYRRAGLPAQRVAHAVVTFNGTPKGVYNVIEPVNDEFLARQFGKELANGNLYEGPWDFTKPTAAISLKDEVEEKRSRDDIKALTAAVTSAADAGYADRLAAKLDLDQFLLLHAVDMVTVAWDGYPLGAWNFYLYDRPKDGRFIFIGTGSNWPYFKDNLNASINIDPFALPALWPDQKPDETGFVSRERVLKIPALTQRLRVQMAKALAAFDVPALKAEFDRSKRILNGTTRADARTKADLATFNGNVQKAYDFVDRRKAIVTTKL